MEEVYNYVVEVETSYKEGNTLLGIVAGDGLTGFNCFLGRADRLSSDPSKMGIKISMDFSPYSGYGYHSVYSEKIHGN